MKSEDRVPILNTARRELSQCREVGLVDPKEEVEVTVYVRRNPLAPSLSSPEITGLALGRSSVTAAGDDIAAAFSADPADISKVEEYANTVGLEILGNSLAKRSISLRGNARTMMSAFGADLRYYDYRFGRFRGRTGSVYVPSRLGSIVEAVFGLDNRKTGRSYLHHRQTAESFRGAVSASSSTLLNTYFPPQVAQLYDYPRGYDGRGQCIGILAFNGIHHGGYRVEALRAYFDRLEIPMPEIVDNIVHGVGNDPGDDGPEADQAGDTSGEIMLDIQVVGSIAPGARIVVYFTEFTERGWVDALQTIVADTQNNPSILSISYGNPEDSTGTAWTRAAITKINEAFEIAAAKRITVCCASGDQGSSGLDARTPDVHVEFPASSPFVLACGGTRLRSFAGVITSETVWNDGPDERGGLVAGGGGISSLFPLPTYQQNANIPPPANSVHHVGRGVPDVSGLADPATPLIIIRLNGDAFSYVGGTSVTAPLWAALVAKINQATGTRLGFFNPLLYGYLGIGVLRDITIGNNGSYRALPGWDACTGLGSPDGVRLLQYIAGLFRDAGGPIGVTSCLDSTKTKSVASFTCISCGRSLSLQERVCIWSYPGFGICRLCYSRQFFVFAL